jgi:hypothetical protein
MTGYPVVGAAEILTGYRVGRLDFAENQKVAPKAMLARRAL